jgi:hypothetical protein
MPPAPDAELIAGYQVTDDARIAWWRARLAAARATM